MNGTNARNDRFSSSPNLKYFGEEKESGALYDVYLKRIHYSALAKDLKQAIDADASGVSHMQWHTCKVLYIKAGTVKKAVHYINPKQQENDPSFANILLCTYKTFTTPEELLDLILMRYRQLNDVDDDHNDPDEDETAKEYAEATQKCLRNFIYSWIEEYPADFDQHPDYPRLNKLIEFGRNVMKNEKLIERLVECQHSFQSSHQGTASTNEDDDAESDCSSNCGSASSLSLDFLSIPTANFAEQLTLLDAELFRKVTPHQCLGGIWAKRNKDDGNELTGSVTATIKQFNRVLFSVVTTILNYGGDSSTPHLRGKIISKWIDIAQECRILKNFSSSKAIITGLHFSPIHRLKKSWQNVNKDKIEIFEDLLMLFSEENNQKLSRDVLWKEGTAKFSEVTGSGLRRLSRRRRRKSRPELPMVPQGTVPYLGTFLTDLTMLDTANADMTEDKLINFEKKRREFEVIAKVKLLQATAKNYMIVADKEFRRWLRSLDLLTEDESFCLSTDIEKDGTPKTKDRKSGVLHSVKNLFGGVNNSVDVELIPSESIDSLDTESISLTPNKETRRSSIGSLTSSSSGEGMTGTTTATTSTIKTNTQSPVIVQQTKLATSPQQTGGHMKLATSPQQSGGHPRLASPPQQSSSLMKVATSIQQTSGPMKFLSSPLGCYVVKVIFENHNYTNITKVYKSIVISSQERTNSVIQKVLFKYGFQDEDPNSYELLQSMDKKEVAIPKGTNVYYALNTAQQEIYMIVRKI
ncbi:Ral guanine nucleotide dissociation stimulator-like 1 [Trichoplax sp. H2]|nr:Ral guanine nucleotide dissociation stimulator-like 1 [Trichoplax sp. H2]|eukprot:RDD43479.1 Ral guanine nucleotide dissociation stimulator-like 1 [Trichoplax sp. H2]